MKAIGCQNVVLDSRFTLKITLVDQNFMRWQGSKLGSAGRLEPRAPLNSSAAPSNFCRGPKDVLFDIHNTFTKMQLGSLKKKTNFEPWIVNHGQLCYGF